MSRKNFLAAVLAASCCLFITTSMVGPRVGHAQPVGPSGGGGGGPFADPFDSFRVVRVTIRSGAFVDAVQMTHERVDGSLVTFPFHGGVGGGEQTLDLFAGEHIIRIDGRFGQFVDSINIHTDRGRTLSGGGDGGVMGYEYNAPPGFEIEGFIGRSGIFIDAIGVILRRIP
jgi:hypothetical protein